MADKDHIRDYDTTASNNTDVDGVNIAEGTAPSNINDAIREVMSHQAELHGDTRGGLTSGGSGGAYTLTTNESLSAYAQSGGLFVWEANHAMPDTATASLNIDSVGVKPLRKDVSVALQQNDIKANQMVISAYEASNDVIHILSVLGNASPITTQGDLVRGGSGGATERVALGSDGEIIRSDGTDAVWDSAINEKTAVDLSSGSPTEADFTSIPSWAIRITVQWADVSTNGTDALRIQIGDSGGLETSGYNCSVNSLGANNSNNNTTTHFGLINGSNMTAARSMHGHAVLTLLDSTNNLWVFTSLNGHDDAALVTVAGGSKSLTAALDRLRFTAGGTDTFDAGTVNIMYE